MKNLIVFIVIIFIAKGTNAQKLSLATAKFSTENNMAFAQPNFDDSKWVTIKTGMNYEGQGFDGYNGYSWYRIKTIIPYSLKEKSLWKDSLKLNFGSIDDCDEIYLNGKLINKSGSFPEEAAGYITTWNSLQEIHLSANDPQIFWDKENVIAIKVYDGNGGGGMFKNTAFIKMVDILDNVNILFEPAENSDVRIVINNVNDKNIAGNLFIAYQDLNQPDSSFTSVGESVLLNANKKSVLKMNSERSKKSSAVTVTFKEKTGGTSISKKYYVPYILTPLPKNNPVINTPGEYGVKPNHPIIYRIPVSGLQPIKYEVLNLPKTLQLDAATGIITGLLTNAQQINLTIMATNKAGTATKKMLLTCGDNIALTPPMGWSSWNCWGLSISEEKVKSAAQNMVDKGLVNYGWSYVNIDDGWEAKARNADRTIAANEKFTDMKKMGDYIHNKGLKLGIYSSPGMQTCGGFLGSYQHELQDATTYAGWGVDFLKHDWCSYDFQFAAEKDTSLAAYKKPYLIMSEALKKQPRDIVYSLCQYGMKNVWEWGASVNGNLWRTTGDMEDSWASFSGIGFSQTKQQAFAKPGHWNDADMMVIGNVGWGPSLHPSNLTPDEQYAHMSLWCLLNNPLLLGCDIKTMDAFTLNLVTNNEVIAIDQNTYAAPATPIIKNATYQIWKKQLSKNEYAIGIFNLSDAEAAISVDWKEISLAGKQKVRDAWRQKNEGIVTNSYAVKVASHGVKLIVCTSN